MSKIQASIVVFIIATMIFLTGIFIYVAAAHADPALRTAGITKHETATAAKRSVSSLAEYLVPGDRPAPHRVYGCRPGSCYFWIKGTSKCSGVVQVRSNPSDYTVWIQKLHCA